jgi:hypothetical protein
MIRFLIYVILFYIIWKFIRVFMKYLSSSKKENPDIKSGKEGQSKYKNIEDAKYTEIKDEDKGKDKD